jgi:tRNA uridine 5-carboxymethylaminomethyl modification enzyme
MTKGTEEPYRMFTSRAEYRLLLRQDNADIRLTEKSYEVGLASQERYDKVISKKKELQYLINDLKQKRVAPDDVNAELENLGTAAIKEKTTYAQILRRPNIKIDDLKILDENINHYLSKYDDLVLEQAEIQVKYEAYIDRERRNSEKMETLEDLKINPDFDYNKIPALSSEAKEKLLNLKPATLGQASRISGVSPADVSVLMVYLGR